MVAEDGSDFSVEEAVGKGDGKALGGEEDGAQVDEEEVGGGGGVAGPEDGDDVGDAQEGDDDQEGLRRLPVLVVCGLPALPAPPQLGHHHREDGDQEEHVGGQQEEHGPDVDPLEVGGAVEDAVVVVGPGVGGVLGEDGPGDDHAQGQPWGGGGMHHGSPASNKQTVSHKRKFNL